MAAVYCATMEVLRGANEVVLVLGTVELNISFLRPATGACCSGAAPCLTRLRHATRAGQAAAWCIRTTARTVRKGRSFCWCECESADDQGRAVTRARVTVAAGAGTARPTTPARRPAELTACRQQPRLFKPARQGRRARGRGGRGAGAAARAAAAGAARRAPSLGHAPPLAGARTTRTPSHPFKHPDQAAARAASRARAAPCW